MSNKKLLLFGGVIAVVGLTFRACSAPSSPVPPSVTQVAEQSVETPASPSPEAPVDELTAQRDQALDATLDASQKLVGDLLCTRKEQFLLEAKLFQQSQKGSAQTFLLGKVKQVQAIAVSLNTKSGTLTGTSREVQSATPVVVDLYAALLAYQEATGGKPSIGLCSVNLADPLILNQRMVDLSTLIQRGSNEVKSQDLRVDTP